MSKTVKQVIELLNTHFPEQGAIDGDELETLCIKNGLVFASGETRFCVYDRAWNEVLKIARWDNVEQDYNVIEYNNYMAACELGIEKIFLPIRPIGTLVCGTEVFAQQRFGCSYARAPAGKLPRMREKARQLSCDTKSIWYISMGKCYDCGRIPTVWYKRAYQVYGKKFMRKFEKFTQDHCIGDLHGGNYGFIGNKPILLDFAGYFE